MLFFALAVVSSGVFLFFLSNTRYQVPGTGMPWAFLVYSPSAFVKISIFLCFFFSCFSCFSCFSWMKKKRKNLVICFPTTVGRLYEADYYGIRKKSVSLNRAENRKQRRRECDGPFLDGASKNKKRVLHIHTAPTAAASPRLAENGSRLNFRACMLLSIWASSLPSFRGSQMTCVWRSRLGRGSMIHLWVFFCFL